MTQLITAEAPEIQALLTSNGFTVRKKSETLARLIQSSEIGNTHETFVEKDGVVVKESEMPITEGFVMARNPTPLSDGSYNEWPISNEVFMKNYGTMPTSSDFAPFKKIITNNIIVVDDQVLKILGSTDGKTAKLGVSWDMDNGMVAHAGDYLFDAGYIVDQREYANTYEEV